MKTVLRSHLHEGDYRRPAMVSGFLHLMLLLFFTFGLGLLPSPPPIELGTGQGGGQGDFVSVGLAADTGGGEGMYKPPITPRADSVAPPPRESETVVEEADVTPEIFTQEKPKPKPKPPPPVNPRPPAKPVKEEKDRPGLIPRESDSGKGPRGGAAGAGQGLGSGRGVLVGSGTGQETIDSWYVQQVERRVGQNWLETSLGQLQNPVEVVATFLVQRNGSISDIKMEKRSGISSVDLAVLRAIRASNPLPPLPLELGSRPVLFRAVFEYPPK